MTSSYNGAISLEISNTRNDALLEPAFLVGSCMAGLLHLTLHFSKTSKNLEDNQKKKQKQSKYIFLKMSYNEEDERVREKKIVSGDTRKRVK